MISSFQSFVWHWEDVNVKIRSVCGGDRKEEFVVQWGSEEERGLSKEDKSFEGGVSENQVCTWRHCKDASSWNKVTNVDVRRRQCSTKKRWIHTISSPTTTATPPPRPSYWQGWQRSHDAPLSLTVKPTSNGQGAVPVKTKKERPLKKYRAAERERKKRRREELVKYVALHLALSKQAYSVCTQALRDVSFKRKARDRIKNQTWIPRLVLSSRGRSSAYVYANLYFAWKKSKKKSVCRGELWSEIKQTAPLQRTSSHLCDVKSKLINKASCFSRRPVTNSGCRGFSLSSAEESHMSKLSLRYRAKTLLVLMTLIII